MRDALRRTDQWELVGVVKRVSQGGLPAAIVSVVDTYGKILVATILIDALLGLRRSITEDRFAKALPCATLALSGVVAGAIDFDGDQRDMARAVRL